MIQVQIQKQLQGAEGRLDLSVDFQIDKGELVCLYGKSGAGKTSILRMIAGLMPPDQGRIVLNHQTCFDQGQNLIPTQERNIAFAFQDYALFPHLSVLENLRLAQNKQRDEDLIQALLENAGLQNLANQRPANLSGGQKQRVAMIRAIAQKPSILLVDEPLSALDNQTRKAMQSTLLHFHRQMNLTTVLVSHDVQEIIRLADRLIHIEGGKILSDSSPLQSFSKADDPIEAPILSVEKYDKEGLLKLLFQNRILEINCPVEQAQLYKKGDIVFLKIKNNRIEIL